MRPMSTALMIIVALAPELASAQTTEPSDCTTTTTTTVHCTGAAAPYGAQPAPTNAAPVYPPNSYPTPAGYGAPLLLDLRAIEHDDWHVTQSSDGTLWRERRLSTASAPVWGTGLALLATSWIAAGGYSIADYSNGVPGMPFLPVLGSWCQAAAVDGDGTRAFYAIDGIVQAGGLVMLLVGLSAGPKKLERMPVMLGGAPIAGGGGVSVSGRF